MKITSEITLKGVDKKDSHEDLIDRVVEKCFEIENLDSDKSLCCNYINNS